MKIMFIRNAPTFIFHDKYELDKKELKEISSKLKDLNLSIKNCFPNYEPFLIYLNVFKNLTQEKFTAFLERVFNKNHQYKFEARYSGARIDSLLFNLTTARETNNLIICEDTNLSNFYPVNKKEYIIDLDKEMVFSERELERLFQYVTVDLQKLNREEEYEVRLYCKKEVITPVVLQYKSQKYCIGFFYYSEGKEDLGILNLKLDVLKDRNVLGKLLIYLRDLSVVKPLNYQSGIRRAVDFDNPFCLNLFNRKDTPTIVEIKAENEYDEKFKELTVGSELEFCYMNSNGFPVSAYEVLLEYLYYDIKEENLEKKLLTESIGTDGDESIGEMRTPAFNLNKNGCAKLIKYIKAYSEIAEECGAMGGFLISFSNSRKLTGFHIHLGFKRSCELTKKEKYIIAENFSLVLDILLASHLILLNKGLRIGLDYSSFTNYGVKNHGFEYRSLPSSIIYKNILPNVLEIFRKVARDYFRRNYVLIEVENFERVSEEVYRWYLGENYKNYFATIEELRDIIRKCELSIDLSTTDYCKVEISKELKDQPEKYLELAKIINIEYVKNCVVNFRIWNSDFKIIEQKHVSYIPFVSDYVLYTFYIPNEENYYDEDFKTEFSKNLYKLIKILEKNSNLVCDSEKVYEDLCKKFDLPEIKESSLVLV